MKQPLLAFRWSHRETYRAVPSPTQPRRPAGPLKAPLCLGRRHPGRGGPGGTGGLCSSGRVAGAACCDRGGRLIWYWEVRGAADERPDDGAVSVLLPLTHNVPAYRLCRDKVLQFYLLNAINNYKILMHEYDEASIHCGNDYSDHFIFHRKTKWRNAHHVHGIVSSLTCSSLRAL